MASKCGQNWKKGYMSRRRVYYTPFLVFAAFWSVFSPHVRKSRFHAVDSGFQVMDSGFQTLVGFRTPWAVFRFPKPKIRIPQAKISLIPESRFLIMGRGLLWSITEQTHGNTESIRFIQWSEKRKGHTVEPPLNGHLWRGQLSKSRNNSRKEWKRKPLLSVQSQLLAVTTRVLPWRRSSMCL